MVRWFHLVLVAVGALLFAVYIGLLPPLGEMVEWLASQPGVPEMFRDTDRAEAFVVLFWVVLLTPVVSLVAFFVVGFAFALSLWPVERALPLPEWACAMMLGAVFAAAGYATSPLWLPRTLWILGLIARAYRIALT
ncbi:MAG: hypothetical protein HY727_00710 [Candidatus Rokubacteria bacterium]|nr:hypothetical protein [Candidatus Rokubacteria bacterium]